MSQTSECVAESCAEDHVPSGRYARMSSRNNSEVTHKREVEDQGMEHHEKSTSAPQRRTFRFHLSLNSNRDSDVISYTMLFLQRRGLAVLLPATSAGDPFWPASHYKRLSWGRGRALSSSACSGFFLHSEDADMAASVHTSRSTTSLLALLVASDTSQILHVPLNHILDLRTSVGNIHA